MRSAHGIVFVVIAIVAWAVAGCSTSPGPARPAHLHDPSVGDGGITATQGCDPQHADVIEDYVPARIGYVAGYRWSGLACVFGWYATERDGATGAPITPPLGCDGDDCGALFETAAACIARYAECGAVHETPIRGAAFSGASAAGVRCGDGACEPGLECSFETAASCQPPDATARWRIRCDDAEDCGTSVCCVGEAGAYLVATCAASCDPARGSPACSTDTDCSGGQRCCAAVARYAFTLPELGVCTDHACEP